MEIDERASWAIYHNHTRDEYQKVKSDICKKGGVVSSFGGLR
jgi:hypothetical protein